MSRQLSSDRGQHETSFPRSKRCQYYKEHMRTGGLERLNHRQKIPAGRIKRMGLDATGFLLDKPQDTV
jgi:hypothetical protein